MADNDNLRLTLVATSLDTLIDTRRSAGSSLVETAEVSRDSTSLGASDLESLFVVTRLGQICLRLSGAFAADGCCSWYFGTVITVSKSVLKLPTSSAQFCWSSKSGRFFGSSLWTRRGSGCVIDR
uniref:(northern house mosquito) hypothetical protein n=1 Tax=Culex pipiens TaxID=7175 RepID=A0A8D8B0E3_CULPI